QFAPAYEALASLYSLNHETNDKAIAAGRTAIQLEPGTLSYALSYGYVLLRVGKVADAKTLAAAIQAAAKTSEDQFAAERLAQLVSEREADDARQAARALHPEAANERQA